MTPAQCRAARALIDIPQSALAYSAGVGLSTVKAFEAGHSKPIASNLSAMRQALESEGVRFINDQHGGPGVRLAHGAF